jgi:hypothetical protein
MFLDDVRSNGIVLRDAKDQVTFERKDNLLVRVTVCNTQARADLNQHISAALILALVGRIQLSASINVGDWRDREPDRLHPIEWGCQVRNNGLTRLVAGFYEVGSEVQICGSDLATIQDGSRSIPPICRIAHDEPPFFVSYAKILLWLDFLNHECHTIGTTVKIQTVAELDVQNGDRRDVMPSPIHVSTKLATGPVILAIVRLHAV